MKTAIVLFNLGGPDRPEAVEPFLRNLFSDPAILRVPGFLRGFLARRISRRRAPVAKAVYDKLGGGSPLLPNTQAQARALESELQDLGEVRCFIAMRYWHPFADEAAREVQRFAPDRILLLPLYPQYSTTTTESSFDDWGRAAVKAGLTARTFTIRDYPAEPGFVAAVARLTAELLPQARAAGSVRILFSAHGLPKKIVQAGDPYADQVGTSVRAVAAKLGLALEDYEVCFQSRVGPLEWIGPYTDDEILRAAKEGKSILLVPIAFVSEHSETLVELDIEYRHLAETQGAQGYFRVPTVGAAPEFIAGLADLVRRSLGIGGSSSLPASTASMERRS
jgi:protoporphyrin/coproporphyrin ferrochelatase